MLRQLIQELVGAWSKLNYDDAKGAPEFRETLKKLVQLFTFKDPPEEAYDAFKQCMMLEILVNDTPDAMIVDRCKEQYTRFIGLVPDEFTAAAANS